MGKLLLSLLVVIVLVAAGAYFVLVGPGMRSGTPGASMAPGSGAPATVAPAMTGPPAPPRYP